MSNKESKFENVVKWVVVAIFAGIVGLVVWAPFHAQNLEQEQNRRKLEELNR